MIIKNGKVFTEEGTFVEKELYIDGDKISSTVIGEVIDATGLYVIPGLTDIHFHGCVGYDFCDGTPEALENMAVYELSNGVTTICPASMTFSEEQLTNIFANAANYKSEKGATLVGINMEGPFISMAKKGAQNGKYIHKPDIEMFNRLQAEAGGLFKLVDIAPEEDGAMEFIKAKKDEVVISLAHTNADYDTAKAAIEAGVTHVTHLYNAMNPITHRNPGPIIAASDDDVCEAELICDNVHIHPAVVRNTLKMFGEDRVIFISDTMMAAGLADGMYELGGQPVIVKGNLAALEDGTIAGSNTNLMKCMVTAVKEMDIPLATAVRCAAVNSAKSVGIYDKYGSITPGKVANAVLLRKSDLSVEKVILKGNII